jgi:hypothetical protein
MKTMLAALSTAALLHAAGAAAQGAAPTGGRTVEMKQSGTPGKAVASRTIQVTATVYAIDLPTRILTIQHDMGGVEIMKVGPAVKNLDQFAVGDTVVVELDQGLVLEFQPPGSEFVAPEAVAKDASGKYPDAVATAGQTMRSTVTITAIDRAKRRVTLQAPTGRIYRVKAGPKIQLDKLKVGDKLLATYVESVAVRLEKPQAK